MIPAGMYSVKWKDFHSQRDTALSSVRAGAEFVDVTLVTEDGEEAAAHRSVSC